MSLVRKCPFLKLFITLLINTRYFLLVYLFVSYAKQGGANVTLTPLRRTNGIRITRHEAARSREFMRYCDTDRPIYDHDDFMDRIISINFRGSNFTGRPQNQIIMSGIFIDRLHILTSYYPFQHLFENEPKDLYNIYFQYYAFKWLDTSGKMRGYYLNRGNLMCGRRVYPFNDTIQYKNETKVIVPPIPYDLMVFRTQDYEFYADGYDYYQQLGNETEFNKIAPVVTELAGEKDDFGEKFKYVSLGMIDNDHIYKRNNLHTVEMEYGDRVIVDCREWFPVPHNPWICILNVEDHVAIGSGAFLISKNKVFGVGSFTMFKGQKSIHVFTDVRVLRDLINTTCTVFDGFGFNRYSKMGRR